MDGAPPTLKILIAGGFGVGKTTFVGAISEIQPLRTEEHLTVAGVDIDDVTGVADKDSTTVAMDFGRITMDEAKLLLFGTPGQERFWFMWPDLLQGAIGAVVLVDTRRLDTSFAALDFFEARELPYIVAANCFNGRQPYTPEQIASALAIPPHVPVLLLDARNREDVRSTLLALLDRLIDRAQPAHV